MRKRTASVVLGVVVWLLALAVVWTDTASALQTGWGYGRDWLFLGPYTLDDVTRPSSVATCQADYLTNGAAITENNFVPTRGGTVNTNYTLAASSGYRDRYNGAPTPTVKYYVNPAAVTEAVDINPIYLLPPNATNPGNQNEDSMVYAWTYANNKTGAALNCYVGVGSDDCVQVKINGVQVGVVSVGRGVSGQGVVQNAWGCTLNPGMNLVMMKIFNGGTGFGLKLRFQTGTQLNPATGAEYIPPTQVELGFFDQTGAVNRTLTSPTYNAGTPYAVRLTATAIAGGAVTVREQIPAGWGAPNITPPALGSTTIAGSTITWTLTLPAAGTATLDYTTLPPTGCPPTSFNFSGNYDAGAGWGGMPTGGDTVATLQAGRWQDALLPWTNAMWISDEVPVGSVSYYTCDDSYQLVGAGHDIWDTADDFEFLYANVTGDFMIQARVDLQTVPNTWTKAGLMARADNAVGSPFVDFMVCGTGPGLTGNRQLAFQWRANRDAGCGEPATNPRAANSDLAVLRLSRTGNVIVGGYDNLEGVVNWTFQNYTPANIPTATPIIVGMALTSHQTGTEARARFDQVTRTGNFPQPTTPPAAPTALNAVSMANKGFLTWTDNSNNELGFKIERKTGAGAFVEIAQQGANATTYLDAAVVVGTTYTYRVRAFNSAGDSAYTNEATVTIVQALGARHWQLYEK